MRSAKRVARYLSLRDIQIHDPAKKYMGFPAAIHWLRGSVLVHVDPYAAGPLKQCAIPHKAHKPMHAYRVGIREFG